MSQTYTNTADYQSYFNELTGRIARESVAWHSHGFISRGVHVGKVMPFEVGKLVDEAADAGFLYDESGKQIWNANDFDWSKNPNGKRYLHCGDKTYCIYTHPGSNQLVDEGTGHPQLKQAETDLPKQFETTVPPLKMPVFKVEKPKLNAFWSGVNAVFRFFTGGKYGLPSMNKYDAAKRRYEERCAAAHEVYMKKAACCNMQAKLGAVGVNREEAPKILAELEPGKWVEMASMEELETMQDPAVRQEKLRQNAPVPVIHNSESKNVSENAPKNSELRRDRVDKLINAMRSYSISPNVTAERRSICAKLCDVFCAMDAGAQMQVKTCEPEMVNNTCDRLAPYFIKNEKTNATLDPTSLLDSLQDLSTTQMRSLLQNMNDKHVSVESAISILTGPDELKQKARQTMLEAPVKPTVHAKGENLQSVPHTDDQLVRH